MERGRDGGIGEKRKRKYIFMFAGMSALASIPPGAVIVKVRRGELCLVRERDGRVKRYYRGRMKMMWLLVQIVEFCFSSVECVSLCACFIDPDRVHPILLP